jgi:hypothetical protein
VRLPQRNFAVVTLALSSGRERRCWRWGDLGQTVGVTVLGAVLVVGE